MNNIEIAKRSNRYKRTWKGFSKPAVLKERTPRPTLKTSIGKIRNPTLDSNITLNEIKKESDPLTLENFRNYSWSDQIFLIKIGSSVFDARSLIRSMRANLNTTARIGVGYGQNPLTRVAFTKRQFKKILARSVGIIPIPKTERSNIGKSIEQIVRKSRRQLGMS